jgi:hypothetical protein
VDNLRQLVRFAAGRPARLVGRITGARSVQALALAADWLPRHHVDLVIDRLTRSDLPGVDEDGPLVMWPPAAVPAALQLLVHRVQRTISGGRAATRTAASGDAQRLTAAHLPTAATLLVALRDTAEHRTRDTFGRLDPLDQDRLARAWLALANYAVTVDRALSAAAWQPD